MRSREPSSSMARRLVALAGSIAIAASVFVATPLRVHAAVNSCDTVDITPVAPLTVHVTVSGCGDDVSTDASFSATARLFQGTSLTEFKMWEKAAQNVGTLVDVDVTVPVYGSWRLEVEYWAGAVPVVNPDPITVSVAAGTKVTVTQPFLTFRLNQMSSGAFPASVNWQNSSPNTATAYRLYRSIDGGSFSLLATLPVTATTGAPNAKMAYTTTVAPNHQWQYKVIPVNGAGDGPEQISRNDTAKGYQNQNSSLNYTYRGTWAGASLLNNWGGSTRVSKIAGSNVTFTFTGTVAAIVLSTGPTRGSFKVYTYEGTTWRLWRTISTYSGVNAYRKTLWAIRWPEPGTHAIRVVVVGTAGHPRVDIDGFMTLE